MSETDQREKNPFLAPVPIQDYSTSIGFAARIASPVLLPCGAVASQDLPPKQ
jgi:hypothetical protein